MTPVSVPLVFPRVVPNNWDTWNKVWEQNKKFVPKVVTTKNVGQVLWLGFDIYVKDNIDVSNMMRYKCKNVNCPDLFPSLFDNIHKLPIEVTVVRVLQSLAKVLPHKDFPTDNHSIRSLLQDNNPKETWWYEDDENNKHYLKLPEETNTWWYNDSKIKHGTDFYKGHHKQLIMYSGPTKHDLIKIAIDEGISKYPDHVLYV